MNAIVNLIDMNDVSLLGSGVFSFVGFYLLSYLQQNTYRTIIESGIKRVEHAASSTSPFQNPSDTDTNRTSFLILSIAKKKKKKTVIITVPDSPETYHPAPK